MHSFGTPIAAWVLVTSPAHSDATRDPDSPAVTTLTFTSQWHCWTGILAEQGPQLALPKPLLCQS